jgi:serine protease
MTHAAPRPSQAARSRRPDTRTILHLEALEDRTLLSTATPVAMALAAGPYDPSQVLVQFRTNTPPSFNIPGAVLGQSLNAVPGLYQVNLKGLSVANALTAFQMIPNVISAEPDYLVTTAGTPNDPNFGSQWGFQNTGQSGGVAGVDVRAVQAWGITTSASNIIVSLIDTGIDYNNKDLYQNIWINQAEIPNQWFTKSSDGTFDKVVLKSQIKTATPGVITFADLNNPANAGLVHDNNGDGRIDAGDLLKPFTQGGWDNNGADTKDGDAAHPDDFFGWNFVSNNNNPFDDNGHGTNVAGILGAVGNNGVGVAGVDWQVQLQAIKAFGSTGLSTIADVVAALGYSINHGAKISNNSWDYLAPNTSLQSALASAQAAGQIVVAAAGNFGNPAPDYPANYSSQFNNIVAVASIDRTGKLASNSNYGLTTVALAAPGVEIVSTAPGGGISTYTGTSQATPFVTGVLALVWQQHPGWTYKQVINQVLSTVTPLASLKGKTITGGIVNAAAAVGPPIGGVPVPGPTPHVLSAAFSGPTAYSLNQILLTFDQVIDPKTLTSANISLISPSNQSIALSFAPSADGRSLVINFGLQAAPGNYTLNLGAGVHDQNGDALAPYTAVSPVAAAPTTFTSSGPTPIPGQGTFFSAITVNQSLTIASLTVTLNISYPVDSNLLLHLQAPDGTDILLVNERGGSGSNFQNTVLTDNASASIRFAAAPFAGSYQPETPLSTFAGKNALGVWKLWIVNFGTGKGVLNSWSLTITPRAASSTKAGVSGTNTTSANAIFASLAGEPSGSQTKALPTYYRSTPAQLAMMDAVFLSEDLKSDVRTPLILAGSPILVEHSTNLGAGSDDPNGMAF